MHCSVGCLHGFPDLTGAGRSGSQPERRPERTGWEKQSAPVARLVGQSLSRAIVWYSVLFVGDVVDRQLQTEGCHWRRLGSQERGPGVFGNARPAAHLAPVLETLTFHLPVSIVSTGLLDSGCGSRATHCAERHFGTCAGIGWGPAVPAMAARRPSMDR